MKRVENKVAVITGAARGIGRSASGLLAEEGAKVALVDRLETEGSQAAREIAAQGGVAEFWSLNVASESEVERVFGQIADRFGRIDILVNNAGIVGPTQPTDETSEAEWDLVQAINVKGVFFCTKHAIPHLRRAGGGSIVNLSSIAGIIGTPGMPAYHASKGAVRTMSKTDALLYARDGIRVNSVHPGYIWTPLVESLAEKASGGAERFREYLNGLHPLGRIGEPKDVAYGILYLASEESKFVTGSELVIDGGYTAQ